MNAPEQSASARTASFLHRFDYYANPVTLTYNQKKSFRTVPGALCSLITGLALIYYFVVSITLYIVESEYSVSDFMEALDYRNP